MQTADSVPVAVARTAGASPWLRRWALASLVANIGIVVTGGAVRLTASGLGCPTWPRCNESSYHPTGELGIHGAIEFGNRLLTFVLVAVAIGTLVAAFTSRPRRPGVLRLAVLLFCGIPLQAVIGGFTVLTQLNPWVVMLHFLASMLMVALATILLRRTSDAQPGPGRVHPLLRRLTIGILGVAVAVVYLGTVTTGSGPHAGDLDAVRTGLDPQLIAQLHADLVFLLVGLTIACIVALFATGAPARVRRAAVVLLAVELSQGLIGYTQYFLKLPALLVAMHMLGASLIVFATVDLVLAARERTADEVVAA